MVGHMPIDIKECDAVVLHTQKHTYMHGWAHAYRYERVRRRIPCRSVPKYKHTHTHIHIYILAHIPIEIKKCDAVVLAAARLFGVCSLAAQSLVSITSPITSSTILPLEISSSALSAHPFFGWLNTPTLADRAPALIFLPSMVPLNGILMQLVPQGHVSGSHCMRFFLLQQSALQPPVPST